MQKWEYKILDGWTNEQILNELGREGWEMVAAWRFSAEWPPAFIFKRPVS